MIARWLRRLADRLDPEGAPRWSTYTFTFERGKGICFRDDHKGCAVWYTRADLNRAWTDADTDWDAGL